jgi:methylated-DNA-[protein]-cysteine S-methyltransferase
MASDGECLTGLWFDGQKYFADTLPAQHEEKDLDVFRRTDKWLDLYFSGTDPDFRPPIRMNGTAFRQEVWQILLTIPFGKTMTYGAIAKFLAARRGTDAMSAQAVGGAVGHNPISLIVPCHRVLGTNGALTGYAGGLDKKTWLLDMERKNTLDKKR